MSDESSRPDPIDWARNLVAEQAWVVHVKTGTVGRVAKFYDGEGHVYEPQVLPKGALAQTAGPVIELAEGHSFHANADHFMRLSEPEARFFAGVGEALATMTLESARFAAVAGIRQSLFEVLFSAALRAQLRALDRNLARNAPTEKPPAPPA